MYVQRNMGFKTLNEKKKKELCDDGSVFALFEFVVQILHIAKHRGVS